jgi:cystathionine beta-lyase/cystathionine gamma-synthase
MTHAALPEDIKLEMGITKTLIRLSVGIEDLDDLKSDLSNALNK